MKTLSLLFGSKHKEPLPVEAANPGLEAKEREARDVFRGLDKLSRRLKEELGKKSALNGHHGDD